MDPDTPLPSPEPSILRWTIGFVLVGIAWGFTTPFIRKAAVNYTPPARPALADETVQPLQRATLKAVYAVVDLLRRPSYAIPLVINLTGSVWFFLLIGKAELSLTVPIVNSLAFLFTVLGEWFAEGKVISKDTWVGMTLVLTGIGLCVHAKQ